MSSGILDSSVLIDCLRGYKESADFVASLAENGFLATHIMVAAELYAGARDKREQALIESFLSAFQIISPN